MLSRSRAEVNIGQASNDIQIEQPTPTRASFELGIDQDDENEEQDEANDDEEFESHYSRHSSPATSPGSEEEGDDDLNLDQVQRVNSVPAAIGGNHSLHNGMHISRSTTALSNAPLMLPPFYGRPPVTHLPPSPSLTSLLRPPSLLNRSTTSTRPTSPDSSDAELTPNDTEAQVAQQARRANPVPPTAPRVPTYEYYGFVLYLASTLAFAMYILWSYLPSPFLHAMGITYYPNRWWALAIPAWIVMLLIYIYVALACYNVEYLTLGFSRVETIVDEAGSVAILDENGRIRKGGSKRYVADLEEKKRREALMQSWDRKRKGGSGRHSKRKGKKEKDELDDWCGYTGQLSEDGSGVASGLSWRQIWNEGTDAVLDVPLGGVCEVLYGEGRDII